MTATTDGRRRRGFALALLVALTALFLAPAVILAPAASAAYGISSGYSWAAAPSFPMADGALGNLQISHAAVPSGTWKAFGCFNTPPAGLAALIGTTTYSSGNPQLICNGGVNYDDGFAATVTVTSTTVTRSSFGIAGYGTVKWAGVAKDGVLIAVTSEAQPAAVVADPPAAVSIQPYGNDADDQLVIGITASPTEGVTGYRWRDNAGSWATWTPLTPVTLTGRQTTHVVDVQATVGGTVWSTSATSTWQPCTESILTGCVKVGAPGGDPLYGDTPPACATGSQLLWHCLYWAGPRPSRPVHTHTFAVRDEGQNRTHAVHPVVGWRCAAAGEEPGLDITPGATRTEAEVTFWGGTERSFTVDCGDDWIAAFYVLGGTAEDSNHDWTDPDPADFFHVTLWWSYGIPAVDENPDEFPPGYYAPEPVPTSDTAVPWPGDDPDPIDPDDPTPVPAGDCDFGITDPSSWLCSIGGILGRLLGLIRSILDFLQNLGSFLAGLLVPDAGVLEANITEVRTAYDDSALGTISSAAADIASPITSLESTVTSCEGAPITIPLDGDDMTFYPLSTCHEFVQTTLGWVMPIWKALIYLGTILLAGRVLGRAFGVDTPGSEAHA